MGESSAGPSLEYDSSHSLPLSQQPLESSPTAVTSGLPNIIQWSPLMRREQYLILVLFICWPYPWGGPNFSSFSLSCIRIIPQHLTLFEPLCVVALPASLCASDSPAGLWLSNHLGREQPLLEPQEEINGFTPICNGINFRKKSSQMFITISKTFYSDCVFYWLICLVLN